MSRIQLTRKLTFALQHADPIAEGTKKITIRKFDGDRHMFKKDEPMIAVFPVNAYAAKMGYLEVTADTEVLKARDVSESICQDDGFIDHEDMMNGMKNYYPDFNDDTEVAIIRFKQGETKCV